MRRATTHISLDANHVEVCKELRKRGVDVTEIMHPVDLICKHGSKWAFVELKTKSGARVKRTQVKWMSETQMPVFLATDADEVIEKLSAGQWLTQRQKNALAAFLAMQQPGIKQWRHGTIEKVLAVD